MSVVPDCAAPVSVQTTLDTKRAHYAATTALL